MRTHTLAISNPYEQIAFKTVSWAIALFLAIYGILAFGMVFDTVDQSSFEKKIRFLNSEVGKLEGDYITRTTMIDLSFAHTSGFQDTSRIKFTTRNTVVGIRSALHNEI